MARFVARIPDMGRLLDTWEALLKNSSGLQILTANEELFADLNNWPRIRFFYYCDDQNGNTLRLYDSEHFEKFGGNFYLEPDGQRKEHFERVIFRGKNMWSGDQADSKRQDSLLMLFRTNPAWQLFPARHAPIRVGSRPPIELGFIVRQNKVDIQAGMSRERRLWYFENVNQLPDFDPQLTPTGVSLLERLRASRK